MHSAAISSNGQIAIPEHVREVLHIKEGDTFNVEIVDGAIILRPVVACNVPGEQAWFWTSEIQQDIQKAEENFKKGNYTTYTPQELIDELEGR